MKIERSSSSLFSVRPKSQMKKRQNLSLDSSSNQKQRVFHPRSIEDVVKQQRTFLSTVQKSIDKQLQKVKENFAKEKEHIVNKAEDEFYTIYKLNPSVREKEDHYFISLEIPEHEVEQVVLSAADRTIKLSTTRRFEDKIRPNEQEFFHTKRSEMHTRKFPTKDIVTDDNSIKKYENGILTFKVFKA